MTCFRLPNGENLNSFCKRNNVCYAYVYRRIEWGMSLEDAISDTIKSTGRGRGRNNCKYLLKNGETLRSRCIKHKIPLSSCYRLLSIGYTPDEAVEVLIKSKQRSSYEENTHKSKIFLQRN